VRKLLLYSVGLMVGFVPLLPGCAAARHEVRTPVPIIPGQPVVFSVDGAGKYNGTTSALDQVVKEERLPLTVVPVEWSHGRGRIISDQTDCPHAREQGQRLAEQIMVVRESCPSSKVYIVAHSAGSLVALSAAEQLPPNSVEHIVLLAPAVSADYDVRPALRSSREGMDVFTSERDVLFLRWGVALIGTTDRQRTTHAAGRVGFQPSVQAPEDAALYSKLRQHSWHECVEWTGHNGGHYGPNHPRFLRAYVLPALQIKRS